MSSCSHPPLILYLYTPWQLPNVPQDALKEIPIRDHNLLRAELLRFLPQSRSCAEVREQEHYNSAIQCDNAPVLATEFHGRIHMESTLRWR